MRVVRDEGQMWEWDEEAKAGYLYVSGPIEPGGVAYTTTVNWEPLVNLDYDVAHNLVGIEFIP